MPSKIFKILENLYVNSVYIDKIGLSFNQFIVASTDGKITKIESGDLVRSRKKTDGIFRTLCESFEVKGKLIPDEEILPMFKKAYEDAISTGSRIFWLDGIGRNPSQINWLAENKILTPDKSKCLRLMVSLETCRKRREHALQNEYRNDREDNDKWEERYHLHCREESEILLAVKSVGVTPITLNGNAELSQLKLRVLHQVRDFIPYPFSTLS